MPPSESDLRISVFQWLRRQEPLCDGIFEGTFLNRGLEIDGRRLTLKGPTGIWVPAGFEFPISITTAARGPYPLDAIGRDGILTYAYRGQDPGHRDNRALRGAIRARTPLIYFSEVRNHRFQAIWPVMILEDHPESLCVRAAIDPAYAELRPGMDFAGIEPSPLDLRRYAWTQTRTRLHQSAFRDVVIRAYDESCAICRLHHPELLDAAHIIPDGEEEGEPVVRNGLSLCKIHHAAYDQNILGISPDYVVHLRGDILAETDGPMLKHGLQELAGSRLVVPRTAAERPDRERLEERFLRFRSA